MRDVGGLDQVVGRARGHFAYHQGFGRAPAHEHRQAVAQLARAGQVAVLAGALQGVAQRADAARDDGDFVHRVGARQRHGHQRMAHFVHGHGAPLLVAEHALVALQAGDDALHGGGEVGHRHGVGAAPRGQQGRFVDQVGQVGAGKARRQRGHRVGVDIAAEVHFLEVHAQHIDTAFAVGPVDQHLAVEAAGPQQGRVEHLGAVGRRQNHHARTGVEAVHFGQQLVQRLFLLVVAPRDRAHAARPAQGVQLVNEDDARRRGAGLLEHVAHARRTDPHEHLDELGARDAEEGYAGLAGHGACQQRLARARRAHQQNALGHVRAQPAVVLGVFQELHRFAQLRLGFVHARHVVEADLHVGFRMQLGAALADGQQTTHAADAALCGKAPADEAPQGQQQQARNHPGQQLAQ